MKPHQTPSLCCAYLDQPSHIKLQHILEDRYSNSNLRQIEIDIFNELNLQHKANEIMINENQWLHTIIIHTTVKQHKHKVIYLAHGFGGTSLMFFPVIKTLLLYGNVVLWEIRGMGLSKKLPKYDIGLQESEHFFVHPIELMLKFYMKFTEIYMIGHSFGAYLILLYLKKYKTFTDKIKEVILLSPVGITSKQEDYKSRVSSLSDFFHVVGNKISWLFGITYKSPFRCICTCFKNKVFGNAVKDCGFNETEEQFMKRLLLQLVSQNDGSEFVFFNYFLPRVLPKFPIEPIYKNSPPETNIKIFYGGEQDWVDKTGAQRLRAKYPSKIQVKIIKECGHNFPFFPQLLKTIFSEVLIRYENRQQNCNNFGKNCTNQKEEENKIHDLLSHLDEGEKNEYIETKMEMLEQ